MKNKIITTAFVIVFAIGFLILNYPTISTLYNQYRESLLMTSYEERVASIPQNDLETYRQEAIAYNERLTGTGLSVQDAFTEEIEEKSEYTGILDMDATGVMGSIEIPGINVYLPIYHGTSTDVLERGVGHLEGTSFPVGGESTHAILTGHRGLPQAELFTDLDQVTEGDVFYLHILNETLAYQVYDIETIEPEDVGSLVIEEGRDLVTLVTCTPYGVNTHRLLIHAERTAYEETDDTKPASQVRRESVINWLMGQTSFLVSTGILLLILLIGIYRLIRGRVNKSRKG